MTVYTSPQSRNDTKPMRLRGTPPRFLSWKIGKFGVGLFGFLGGAVLGLVAGWFVPGICLMLCFRTPDQAGLILLLTAPVGAVIGGVAGICFRKWWAWGTGAIIGLGPATVLLLLGGGLADKNPALLVVALVLAPLLPVICAVGAHALQVYLRKEFGLTTDQMNEQI